MILFILFGFDEQQRFVNVSGRESRYVGSLSSLVQLDESVPVQVVADDVQQHDRVPNAQKVNLSGFDRVKQLVEVGHSFCKGSCYQNVFTSLFTLTFGLHLEDGGLEFEQGSSQTVVAVSLVDIAAQFGQTLLKWLQELVLGVLGVRNFWQTNKKSIMPEGCFNSDFSYRTTLC